MNGTELKRLDEAVKDYLDAAEFWQKGLTAYNLLTSIYFYRRALEEASKSDSASLRKEVLEESRGRLRGFFEEKIDLIDKINKSFRYSGFMLLRDNPYKQLGEITLSQALYSFIENEINDQIYSSTISRFSRAEVSVHDYQKGRNLLSLTTGSTYYHLFKELTELSRDRDFGLKGIGLMWAPSKRTILIDESFTMVMLVGAERDLLEYERVRSFYF